MGQRTTDSEGDLALIDGFVRPHYRRPGALRLHRHAIGWDLLRAPVNVALALVLVNGGVKLGRGSGGIIPLRAE